MHIISYNSCSHGSKMPCIVTLLAKSCLVFLAQLLVPLLQICHLCPAELELRVVREVTQHMLENVPGLVLVVAVIRGQPACMYVRNAHTHNGITNIASNYIEPLSIQGERN